MITGQFATVAAGDRANDHALAEGIFDAADVT